MIRPLLIWAFVLTSAACASDAPIAAPSSTPPAPTTSVAPVDPASPTPDPSSEPTGYDDFVMFTAPSGNIGCGMSTYFSTEGPNTRGSYVRCDIGTKAWEAPPLEDCDFDSGNAVGVGGDGPAGFECVSDAVAGGPVVPYDSKQVLGDIACDVTVAGVACTNRATDHGFELSQAAYRLF